MHAINVLRYIRQSKISVVSRVEERRGCRHGRLRFPSPLIKPDVRISRIRLSDWLHFTAHGAGPK